MKPIFTVAPFIEAKTWKQPINRGMGKEVLVPIYNEILLSHKKKETMPFAATCMDLEIILPSEAGQRRKNSV